MRGLLCAVAMLGVWSSASLAADNRGCHLTPEDKSANAKLSFDEFDQKGIAPSTWRKLEEAGCHSLAVVAAEDYLAKGPALAPHEKSVVLFHIAQSLAFDGDNARASLMVAAAMPADRKPTDELDWPTYLLGTWAFLVKDKSTLDTAAAKIATEPGDRNKLDGGILAGLSLCFGQSYTKAYNDCRSKRRND